MESLNRAALDFFKSADKAASLEDLVHAFAPVAAAADCYGGACFHAARAGRPFHVRPMFSWGLGGAVQADLLKTIGRDDAETRGVFMSSAAAGWRGLERGGRDGWAFPIHGPMGEILCLVMLCETDSPALSDPKVRMTLQACAVILANRGSSLAETGATPPSDRPTAREIRCAELAGEGKNDWEIGHILGLSEDTVAFHLDQLKTKLGVRRRAQIPAGPWPDPEEEGI